MTDHDAHLAAVRAYVLGQITAAVLAEVDLQEADPVNGTMTFQLCGRRWRVTLEPAGPGSQPGHSNPLQWGGVDTGPPSRVRGERAQEITVDDFGDQS